MPDDTPMQQLDAILAVLERLGGWEQTLEDRADLTVARAALEDVRERLLRRKETP